MDKLDVILERLNILDRIESDIKALKADNRETHKKLNKLDELSAKQEMTWQAVEMTWQAVKELRDDKTEINELRRRIEILESKIAM